MAKPILSTNYKDDILNVSTEGKRKYRMNYNDDGTVSFDDVTPYDQTGSDFGAGDINLTNEAVNQSADAGKIIDDPDTAEATTEKGYMAGVQLFNHVNNNLTNENGETFRYGYQDGKRGVWVKEADTDVFVPFNSLKITDILYAENNSNTNPGEFTLTFPENGEYIVICRISGTTSLISTTCEFSNPDNIIEELFFDTGNYYYERIVKYNATANDTVSVSAELGGVKKRSVLALRLG